MSLTETSFTVTTTIHPDDVAQFTNLGFDITQRHMELLAEIMKSVIEDNYFEDLFEALLQANQRVKEEESTKSLFGESNRKLREPKNPEAAKEEAEAFWGVES